MRKRKTVKKLQIYLLSTNNEGQYEQFRYAMTESAQLVLPVVESTAKQKWMTAHIEEKKELLCAMWKKDNIK